MLVTRTRVSVAMAMACFCFGCKGAGGMMHGLGSVAKVATAVAVTGARVAAVAAVAGAHSGGGSGSVEPVEPEPGAEPVVYVAGPPPPVSVHPRCIELPPQPERPGDPMALRTVDCGGRLMVQDPVTGNWRPRATGND